MNLTLKKLTALLLLAALALSLCACGSSSASTSDAAPASASPAQTAAEETAAPEFTYTASFTSVSAPEIGNLSAKVMTEDGWYATGSAVIGSIAPEGVEEEYYGQYDITEPCVSFIAKDGTNTLLEGFEPILAGEAEEGMYSFDSDSYIMGLARSSSGSLITFEVVYRYWNDIDGIDWNSDDYYDHHHYSQTYYVRELDSDGKELARTELECPVSEYLYSVCVLDADDALLVIRTTEDGSYSILGIRPGEEEPVYEIPVEESISNIFRSEDGTIYLTLWGAGMQMAALDLEAKTLGEPITLPSDAYDVYTGGGDYPLYYSSGVYFYGLDPETGESTRLYNWLDCDVNPDYISSIFVTEDGEVCAFVSEFDSSEMEYSYYVADVTKIPYDSAAQKTELTFATLYLSSATRDAVISFNRKSSTARIVVKDYSEYNTEDDYSAGLTKLTTEIMAGNCPDIIDLSGISATQLASKGLVEDLYPYLDADEELDRADFFENVLAAAEVGGKLVSTVSYFTLDTVVGASSVVGDEPGWTYAELKAALRDMPDGCTAFDVTVTRDDVLNKCLNLDLDSFFSWETGEVNFNTDEFVDILEFANTFPASYNWETYDYSTDNAESRIAVDEQMLYSTTISDFNQLMYIETCFHGAPVTFIGFPTASGTGSTIGLDSGYAMASSCKDKDAAWQFLRTFFTEKYYKNNVYYGLPVQKSLFEREMKELTTVKYQIDDSGNYKLDANGEKIPEEKYFAVDSYVYTAYCLSQDVADKFEEALENTTKTSSSDDSIRSIVTELAAAYFSGQKSAEETARLIQSKANIYVNEQR